jgi:2-methylcitrate dehydratase PrpD
VLLVDELAARAHRVATDPLPPPVRAAARVHLTDTAGALLAGYATLHERVRALGAGPAFAGGVYTHCWEVAAIHRASVLLPGVVVLPAVLAALERGVPFERVLRAVLAGYEVTVAAGLAVGSARLIERGWWPTGLVGPLGAAAAVCVLRGEPRSVIASAIGLAAQQAGGTVAGGSAEADGRYLLAGHAAERAAVAARAAAAGWQGPLDILDDARSPLRRDTLRGNHSPGFLLPELSLKRHAAAKHLQTALDAVLAAVPPGAAVRGIEARLPARLARVVDRPPPFGSALYALASAQYTLAVAALRGHCTPWDYTAGSDPAVLALAQEVTVVPVPADAGWGATVIVRTDARAVSVERKQAIGDPGEELSDMDILTKFDTLAGRTRTGDEAQALGHDLRHGDDGRALAALTERVAPMLTDEAG